MGKQLALFARIMAAAFLLILAILVVCNTVTKDRDFSEKENRVLSGKPDFTWSRLTDGRYMTQFETYVNDQFVFRDGWIQLKTLSDTLLGKKKENGVYLGKTTVCWNSSPHRRILLLQSLLMRSTALPNAMKS